MQREREGERRDDDRAQKHRTITTTTKKRTHTRTHTRLSNMSRAHAQHYYRSINKRTRSGRTANRTVYVCACVCVWLVFPNTAGDEPTTERTTIYVTYDLYLAASAEPV